MVIRFRKSIIAGVLTLATVVILFLLPAPKWVQRVTWDVESQDRFRQFGEGVLLKAAAQDGRLSATFDEWIRKGLISQEDVSFRDKGWDLSIRVSRTLRYIPDTSYPRELVLLVETYDPPQGYARAFALNGTVYEVSEDVLEEFFKNDNALRLANGLEELENPRIKGD